MRPRQSLFALLVLAPLYAITSACSSGSTTPVTEPADSGATSEVDGSAADAGSSDAAVTGFDAANDPLDGPPTRKSCTSNFGNALSTFHGRLDGTLVAIVPPSAHMCNADSTHVHLQIQMNAAVYDVAVNVDGLQADLPHAMVDGAWAEGWHSSDALDYPTALGVHSTAFKTTSAQGLMAALENANHLSVFATAYGPTGVHLVHRKGNNSDGAIVVNPLGVTPHWFLFRFASDSF
jgi:hypothetical protein